MEEIIGSNARLGVILMRHCNNLQFYVQAMPCFLYIDSLLIACEKS